MKRFFVLAALVAVAATVGVSSVEAAPIPGGWRISGASSYIDYLFLGTRVNGVYTNGLTSLGCPFVLHDYGQSALGTLSATYKGWRGPTDENTMDYQVLLRAHVTGTVQDVYGNTYTVTGHFTDRSTRNMFGDVDLMFDGPGQISLSGPAGTVVGRADFRFVEGPPSFELTFTSIKNCTI